jgi:1-acyl-sn-glycerol-3-phosphate acyltransferase
MAGDKSIGVVLHTLIDYGWIMAATFVFGLVAIATSFFSRNGDAVHHVARMWGRSILWVSGIRTATSGFTNQMRHQSYIYMTNHQSNFDIPVLYGALPVQFRWLAKAELFRIPVFGRGMRGAGYISIDRSNRQSAFKSLERAVESIRHGTSVMIFPEGTRSRDGRLLPFKKGGFVMAVDAGVPIVPVVITGTHAIMPKGALLIRRRRVQVHVGAPIETAGFNRKTKEALMAKVRATMLTMTEEVCQRGGRG